MQNWIEIRGHKISIPSEIQFQLNSPFNDIDVFIDGTKTNKKGEFTLPFTATLSFDDLVYLNMPHLLQKIISVEKINDVGIYSDGLLIDIGLLLITDTTINLNNKVVECQFIFFYSAAAFVSEINNKKVCDLVLDGIRFREATDDVGQWNVFGENSIHFDPTPFNKTIDSVVVGKFRNTWFYDHPNAMYVNSTNISDYATDVVNDGDEYICFPTVKALNDSSTPEGYRWLNHWNTDVNKMTSTRFSLKKLYPGTTSAELDEYEIATVVDFNNSIVPMYYYYQVIKHCFLESGYKLITDGTIIEDEHFKKITIVNSYDIKEYWIGYGVGLGSKVDVSPGVVDFTNYGDGKGIEETLAYYEKDVNINPKNHLPDCSIQDFLIDFMNKFNVHFEFDGKNVYIKNGEFDVIDREIVEYHPEIKTKILHDNVGVSMQYEFTSDKIYDSLKNFNVALTSIKEVHDNTSLALVPAGEYFYNSQYNKFHLRLSGVFPPAEYIGDNFVGYKSGEGKEIKLILPPVSMSNIYDTYKTVLLLTDSIDFKTQIPIIDIAISRKQCDTILFKFNSINLVIDDVNYVREFYDTEKIEGDIRSGTNDFKLGFYYGLNGLIQQDDADVNISRYPCMTSHCYITWNATKQGWFNLSILGEDGFINRFCKHFIDVLNSRRQITFQAYETIRVTKKNKYNRAILIRGAKVYTTQINFTAPNYNGVQYIGYVLDQFAK